MGELHDGLDRGIGWKGDPIAQGPVVATTVAGEGRAHVRAPQHDSYRVDEKRGSRDREPIGGPHRGTMESKLTLVNDREAQRVRFSVAPVVDDQIRSGSKVFPHRSRLLGPLDRLAVDARHGVPRAKVE